MFRYFEIAARSNAGGASAIAGALHTAAAKPRNRNGDADAHALFAKSRAILPLLSLEIAVAEV